MNRSEINIRDPFILVHEGSYYLYGTRSETCWGKAEGFDCYISRDLEEFEGPIEIFRRSQDFFADRFFWAPECYFYQNAFWLVTTLGAEDRKKGIYVLRSEKPEGPFTYYSALTPEDWSCIDGTLCFEDEIPYLIFSHSFEDGEPGGDFCCCRLKTDLSGRAEEPELLFQAKTAPWARPVPFAKAEFGMDGDVYFSDGPSLLLGEDNRLYMTASSWSEHAYAVGVAVSDSGRVKGPWRWQEKPLYPENGGHGMFFRDRNGQIMFTLHTPNDKYAERPVFCPVTLREGEMVL